MSPTGPRDPAGSEELFHSIVANIVQLIETIAMVYTIIVTSQARTMVDFLALQI